MKVYFLDTSALVKRYHQERGSQVIDAVFAEQDRQIVISDLSIIELGSALAKKVREGEISVEKYHRAKREGIVVRNPEEDQVKAGG